jgi:ectoine hydroxylase-related dioxygenase (phytanoyl-CoA dioxygenase family)
MRTESAHMESALPSWDVIPEDPQAATIEIKRAIRAAMEANGRTVEDVVAEIEAFLTAEVADVEQMQQRGEQVWPQVQFADIAAGAVPAETVAHIHRRGSVVVKGNFDRATALAWDQNIVDYVTENQFFENYRGPGDDFFGTVGSKPEIYPIYWSGAQMQARQHPNMAATHSFLNRLWTYDDGATKWFDPDHNLAYPDRIRRRPPGTTSKGLGTHLDPGTLDLWMSSGYQRAFASLFRGDFASHNPWSAAHRVDAAQYPGSTMCSAFRTFQGWTALCDMKHDQGVLQTIPIPKAFAYLLLRPLLDDVADDDLCGVQLSRTFPVNERFHSILTPAKSLIPDVEAGDTVWWHCDLIHSVAPVVNQQGWGNVMYIPAAPWCAKNAEYADRVRESFLVGNSANDFPNEHYEASWTNRFGVGELNALGRAGLGIR